MCLYRKITEKKLSSVARKNLKAGVGYKVFKVYDNKKLGGICNAYKFKRNKWMKDKCKKKLQYEINLKQYQTGFHICLTKKGAMYWKDYSNEIIHKVKFKNVNVIGTQIDHPVVVVREMIIKESVK